MVVVPNKNNKKSEFFDCLEFAKQSSEDNKLLRNSLSKEFSKKASFVAHEIKNPISSMELHSCIISKKLKKLKIEDATIQTSINCLLSSLDILKSVANGIKTFNEKIQISAQEQPIDVLANQVVEMIRPLFDEKNIKLEFENTQKIYAYFDSQNTYRIIFNLLKNALEATTKGEVKISIIERETEISLRVKDTGSGVALQNIEKIFYPNFTTKKTGSGIGLAEAQRIARAQNGDLKILTTSTSGSIFELTIPKESE